MSTHNIVFFEKKNKQNYPLIIIKYHRIRNLTLLSQVVFLGDHPLSFHCMIDFAQKDYNRDYS